MSLLLNALGIAEIAKPNHLGLPASDGKFLRLVRPFSDLDQRTSIPCSVLLARSDGRLPLSLARPQTLVLVCDAYFVVQFLKRVENT